MTVICITLTDVPL